MHTGRGGNAAMVMTATDTETDTGTEFAQKTTAHHIRNRRFANVRRGFDRDQVRDYLQRVADHVEALEEDLRRVQSDAGDLVRGARSAKEEAYAEFSTRIADVLRSADVYAEETRRTADEEAERALLEARVEAERIRTEAEAKAAQARREGEETVRRATEEAERMLVGLSARRDGILAELQTMRERLLGVVHRLETTMAEPESVSTSSPKETIGSGAPADHPEPGDGISTGWEAPGVDTIDLILPEIPFLDDDDLEEDEPTEAPPSSGAS
jgi:DivIVA domain-containing protein